MMTDRASVANYPTGTQCDILLVSDMIVSYIFCYKSWIDIEGGRLCTDFWISIGGGRLVGGIGTVASTAHKFSS